MSKLHFFTVCLVVAFSVSFVQAATTTISTTPHSSSPSTPKTAPNHNNGVQLNFTAQHDAHVTTPFNITCTVGGNFVDHNKKNYSIVFHKTAYTYMDSAFGQFDVEVLPNGHQQIIFTDNIEKNEDGSPHTLGDLTLTPTSTAYPVFSLRAQPRKLFYQENYWCQLQVLNPATAKPELLATSNRWVTTPTLSLTGEKVKSNHPSSSDDDAGVLKIARCTIDHLDLAVYLAPEAGRVNSTNVPFEVSFWVDDHQMAVFNVTSPPQQLVTFTSFELPSRLKRTVLGHGHHFQYPTFEVLYRDEDKYRENVECILWYGGLPPKYLGGNARSGKFLL